MLVDVIHARLKGRNRVSMLDVGIADGSSAIKVMAAFADRGVRLDLTGVDPHIPATAYSQDWIYSPKLMVASFDEFEPRCRYDVVNATQSLYYLGKLDTALRKLVSLLSRDGVLAITIWDDGCILKILHDRYLSPRDPAPGPKDIANALSGILPPTYTTQTYYFEGPIALNGFTDEGRLEESVIDIARRSAHVSNRARMLAYTYIRSLGPTSVRRNTIIVASPSC